MGHVSLVPHLYRIIKTLTKMLQSMGETSAPPVNAKLHFKVHVNFDSEILPSLVTISHMILFSLIQSLTKNVLAQSDTSPNGRGRNRGLSVDQISETQKDKLYLLSSQI
jgi:hypothetical protein